MTQLYICNKDRSLEMNKDSSGLMVKRYLEAGWTGLPISSSDGQKGNEWRKFLRKLH